MTDLMPQIMINYQYEDVDRLGEEILFPTFRDMLTKKGITTDLNLQLGSEKFGYEDSMNIQVMISKIGPNYPAQCEEDPKVARGYFEKAVQARPISEDIFGLPNYMRRKPAGEAK